MTRRLEAAKELGRRFLRKRVAVVALTVFTLIVLACALAPLIAPYSPNQDDLTQSLQGPSGAHLLGTDELGRDVLSRLLYGGRPSLGYAAIVAVVALLAGLPLGLVSGYSRGWAGRSISVVTEVGLTMPVMLVVIVILSVFHDYFLVAMISLGLLLAPPIVRNIRGPVLGIRNEPFVDAAVVAGSPPWRIISFHILPRVLGPVLVQAMLVSAAGLLFTVGLAYLGFGNDPPDPSWGSMIAEGAQVVNTNGWLLFASGAVVGVVVLCLGLVGDGIRDATVEAWSGKSPAARRRGDRAARRRSPLAPRHARNLPASQDLLDVRDLSVAFDHEGAEVGAVSGVSFRIRPGETVGLVGESGCGKTSVARSIIGLLPGGGRVTNGEVWFEDRDLLQLGSEEMRRRRGAAVSYIAQDPMSALDPAYRVGVQLEEKLRAHSRIPRSEARRRAIELLERVRLPNPDQVAGRYPHELSGGMAQRVLIAKAIASGPKLLIADEPTTALDVTVQAQILSLLRSLQRESGMAILLVSHDWGVVAELCRRAIVMYAGEIVEQGSLRALVDAPAHPYTQALLRSRPTQDTERALPLPTMAGTVLPPGHWPKGCRFADRCPYRLEACERGPVAIEALAGERRGSRCLRATEVLGQATGASIHA